MTRIKRYASSTDVAKLAGVSQSAVSRTYKDGASVSDATRQKVIEAAAVLNYRPSLIPQIMLTHRSRLVAVVMGGLANPYYANVLERFAERLQALGYQVLLMHTDASHALDGVLPRLASYRVDAVVSALPVISTACADALARLKVPVVSFNTPVSNDWLSSVYSDSIGAGKLIADLFLAQGGRRFGFIAGPTDSAASCERLRGYRDRLHEAGVTGVFTAASDYSYEGGRAAASSLLAMRSAPDALFCANDLMGLGAIDAVRSKGLCVPADVMVAGFDNTAMSAWAAYDLTTIVQDAESMVEQAIEILRSRLTDHAASSGSRVMIPTTLVPRGSTARRT